MPIRKFEGWYQIREWKELYERISSHLYTMEPFRAVQYQLAEKMVNELYKNYPHWVDELIERKEEYSAACQLAHDRYIEDERRAEQKQLSLDEEDNMTIW